MSLKQPLLTAIIFAYNHEDTIANAIKSVLEQRTDYPYEIWLCEDCSTDTTLDICKKFAQQYPDRIKLFAQSVNTFYLSKEQNHVYKAFNGVTTKYFSYLDGDDYWCDEDKIQISLDILENNPEYTTFAHDTLVTNHIDGTEISLAVACGLKKGPFENKLTLEQLIHSRYYFHPSSRIHRNIIDFSQIPDGLLVDTFLLYVFLDKGHLYFYDKIMSVYNITGLGYWSKLSKREQIEADSELFYKINHFFNYKFDVMFTKMVMKPKLLKLLKLIFQKRLGWRLWHYLKFNKKT